MPEIARRTVLQGMAALPIAAQLPRLRAAGTPEATVKWLEGTPAELTGSTWGTPWPKGQVAKDQTFALTAADGAAVPVQTWPLAYWPDGSLKWSAFALPPASAGSATYTLKPGTPAAPATPVTVTRVGGAIEVDTGVIQARIRTGGTTLIESLRRGGAEIARAGRLVALQQATIGEDEETRTSVDRYLGEVAKVTVEQSGPVRAVLRIEGRHTGRGRPWLPFTVRLYFYAGAENLRMVHTFVYDRDGSRDYVAGLGVRFAVPMSDAAYDRHVRFVGDGHGLLTEAVQGITGLRRDPGAAVRAAQVAGQRLPDPATWDTRVTSRLQYIPRWGDYTLAQLSAGGFTIAKRTGPGHGWIPVDQGGRASGFGYLGGASGGLAFGMRDFWQRHPTQLDVRGAASGQAEVTLWLWSPRAGAMDTRFFHDDMGETTYATQLEGLNITYEDFEPGFGTPYGIARTSELFFWVLAATPPPDRLFAMADLVRTPPQIVNTVDQLVAARVFGGLFTPVDRSTPERAAVEDHLDFLIDFYRGQVEQRHWYGFWDHGDVMHTYDEDRHVWRYDVGGYAWDNSELSTDLWIWYAYLRTGRADIYRFAEAMTRHTGEVDQYHLGPWATLGTRHGVQHWADSAKQVRISTAVYRRFLYFLTADERTGDILHKLIDSDRTFLTLDPNRKVRTDGYRPGDPTALSIGLGTDYSGLAAAWLTEWERGGDPVAHRKLLATMRTIGAMPNGFVTGAGLYDLRSGEFGPAQKVVSVSDLSAMFGQVEINAELIDLLDVPSFTTAWLKYCKFFNATKAEQAAEFGADFGTQILRQGHSRLTAYASIHLQDPALATRAWNEFYTGDGYGPGLPWKAVRVTGTLNPVDEATWVSTNYTSLYGLAAIQNLALIGDRITKPS